MQFSKLYADHKLEPTWQTDVKHSVVVENFE